MEYKGVKLRHELKYLINYNEYNYLKTRLAGVMAYDVNSGTSGYHIRSLYFDDIYHSALSEKVAGIQFRQKYRVRIYNKSDTIIKLERKEKYNNYISKQSYTLSKDDFYKILEDDAGFLLKSGKDMPMQMYFAMRTKLLKPAVIVDYHRDVFVLDEGNVRITFDKNLQAGIDTSDIFEPNILLADALDPGLMVLEVKYDDYIPNYIRSLLQITSHSREAVSKYVYCRNVQYARNPKAMYLPNVITNTINKGEKIYGNFC